MARQRYCRRLTRYRNTLRVSADPVGKPAAQTRAESRVLDLRKLLRERDRLSAGGRWIRTSGFAPAATTLTERGPSIITQRRSETTFGRCDRSMPAKLLLG